MAKKNFDPVIYIDEDGLEILDVGIWALEKYQLLGGYCDMFTKGMRAKWDNLIYIDLFAGPGYSRIRENNKVVRSSPLIALSIPTKFDKYIFCEENPDFSTSLSERIKRDFSKIDVIPFEGDCNLILEDIKKAIPQYSKSNTVLTFCFLDPFNLNLDFETVRHFADDLVDFLILQALHMDANRNFKTYIDENSRKIERYLGNPNWREEWQELNLLPKDFVKFLADQYDEKMKELGYLQAIRHAIKLPDKNFPLYYLTFYSKHERGLDFFKKVDEYSTDQLSFGI
ncbi:MAG: three-Cys-motif partner protein TcmP [Spirochaetes bacterium]|nr:three-Cys-motif partner protein TcmP [Spirochaetota bacterium]